jgi:hypothetical protein
MTETRPAPTVEGLERAIELLVEASDSISHARHVTGVTRTAWRNGIDINGAEKDIDKLITCLRDYIEHVGEEEEETE